MKRRILHCLLFLLVLLGAVAIILPFVWLLSMTLADPKAQTTAAMWQPQQWRWANLPSILVTNLKHLHLVTSFAVALITAFLQLLVSGLAAFVFVHFNFWGKRLFWILLVCTLVIPTAIVIIPNYQMLMASTWTRNLSALIGPEIVNVGAVWLLIATFQVIAQRFYVEAQLDGASDWYYLRHVVIPLTHPSLITVFISQFCLSWNNVLWPLVVNRRLSLLTWPLGLQKLGQQAHFSYQAFLAITTWAIMFLAFIVLWLQKDLLTGIATLVADDDR